MSELETPVWDPDNLQIHFEDHCGEPGHATISDYEACSRLSVKEGDCFSYLQRAPGGRLVQRVGCYHPRTRHLSVLNEDGAEFVSHFAAREAYVEKLRMRGAATQEDQR